MRWVIIAVSLLVAALARPGRAQTLHLPPRPADALTPREFATFVSILPPPPDPRREELIYAQITAGNVPDWLRKLVQIKTTGIINGFKHTVIYYVTPDYFCLGSDTDYLLMPMTPVLAQRVANLLGCSLPTRKMVKDIWAQAPVKLTPEPLTPGPDMTSVPVFARENSLIYTQRQAFFDKYPPGSLVAGDKKDVVISALILTNFHKSQTPVVIYGWQKTNGIPIQPLYNGHDQIWADYSHGIRLVQEAMTIDGTPTTVSAVLTNPALAALLSDETNFPGNTIPRPYYLVPSGQ